MNKRLTDINTRGVPLKTCLKAEEIVKSLNLDDKLISYYGDPFEDPPEIAIEGHQDGLIIKVSFLE